MSVTVIPAGSGSALCSGAAVSATGAVVSGAVVSAGGVTSPLSVFWHAAKAMHIMAASSTASSFLVFFMLKKTPFLCLEANKKAAASGIQAATII